MSAHSPRGAFLFRVAALLSLAAGLTLSFPSAPGVAADDPAVVGQWSPVTNVGIVAIHASLLPDGRVLFFDSVGARAKTWNPATGASLAVPNNFVNVFCSGHTFLPDGKLFVGGGHVDNGIGPKTMCTFDYQTNTWARLPDTNQGRWYPSCTALANGDTLVSTGNIDNALGINRLLQVYQSNGTVRNLDNAFLYLPMYAFMHVGPDGRVFNSGPNQRTRYINTAGTGSYSNVADSAFGYRDFGTAVEYDAGKILLVGGHDPPTETAEVIDLNVTGPEWRPVAPLPTPRRQINATVLPDGKVLVTGGSRLPGFNNPDGAMLSGEMWDPVTEQWTTTAAMQTPRIYHSTALLLADGRVLCGGGGEPANEEPTPHPNVEIYSPPYLFKGARPTVTGCPTGVGFGQSFTVSTPQSASISAVHWIRLGSVTHSYDQSQRLNRLAFTRGSGFLTVTAPANGNLAPPGHYLLFILNSIGVPSVGRVVRIGIVSPPPQAPTDVTASAKSASRVRVSWRDRSTDESGFRVERSTNGTTFALRQTIAANVTAFDDSGLAANTLYYYRVSAFNSGNVSSPSNIASVRTLTFEPHGTGLAGEYFNGITFGGAPVSRIDKAVSFQWGTGSPATGIGADDFSVQWRGEIQPRFSETYTLRVISDESVRLWIDQKLVIDDYSPHTERKKDGSIALVAGRRHDIRIAFREMTGRATCQLQWQSPSQALEVVPTQCLYPTGLTGRYFDNPDFTALKRVRQEGPINYSWGTAAPVSEIQPGTYSVRWTGFIAPRFTETYTLTVPSAGAVRLYIDGTRLIDAWSERGSGELTATVALTAGKKHAVTLEYGEFSGSALVRMAWRSPSQPSKYIPRISLFAE